MMFFFLNCQSAKSLSKCVLLCVCVCVWAGWGLGWWCCLVQRKRKTTLLNLTETIGLLRILFLKGFSLLKTGTLMFYIISTHVITFCITRKQLSSLNDNTCFNEFTSGVTFSLVCCYFKTKERRVVQQ